MKIECIFYFSKIIFYLFSSHMQNKMYFFIFQQWFFKFLAPICKTKCIFYFIFFIIFSTLICKIKCFFNFPKKNQLPCIKKVFFLFFKLFFIVFKLPYAKQAFLFFVFILFFQFPYAKLSFWFFKHIFKFFYLPYAKQCVFVSFFKMIFFNSHMQKINNIYWYVFGPPSPQYFITNISL